MEKTSKTTTVKTKTVKIATIDDIPDATKSIEHIESNGGTSNKEQPKRFLTKKKIILTVVFLLVAIGFAIVTVRPILKVNWNSFDLAVGTGIALHWGWLWLFLILVQVFVNLNRGFFTFIPRLKKWGYKISYKDYIIFSITCAFIGAISPGNFLYDPYNIFWLKTHGVPTSKAVSMFFVNSLFWQISQIIITMPCFIICCLHSEKLVHTSNPWGKVLFSSICIGVGIDFIGLAFFVLLNWSKQFHFLCARFFNWVKKIFHMKYHTKEETAKKYKEKAVLKRSFYEQMKDWRVTLYILFFWTIGDVIGLFSMVVCLNFVQNTLISVAGSFKRVYVGFDIGWALVCARLAAPANRLNILPGQAMGYPAALKELLNIYGGWNIIGTWNPKTINFLKETTISNSLLAGQIFLGWIPAFVGIIGFIFLTKQQIRLSNQGKLFTEKK